VSEAEDIGLNVGVSNLGIFLFNPLFERSRGIWSGIFTLLKISFRPS